MYMFSMPLRRRFSAQVTAKSTYPKFVHVTKTEPFLVGTVSSVIVSRDSSMSQLRTLSLEEELVGRCMAHGVGC